MRRRRPSFEAVGAERRAFVDAEGLNATVGWRRIRADIDICLTGEALEDLAARFDFPAAELRRFDTDLAIALDPEHRPGHAALDLKKAATRARKSGKIMGEQLGRAMDEVDEAHLLLDDLDSDPLQHGAARRRLRLLQEKMFAAHEALSDLRAEARWVAENGDGALLEVTPSDLRQIADLRRRHVLDCIFTFWGRSGRPLTVTTDGVTFERRGALIDFTQAVVVQVTEPPAQLHGETIRKDLERHRKASRL